MEPAIYEFGNGLKIRRADLMDVQVARYTLEGNPNLHEPVEEGCMLDAFATDAPPDPVFLDIGAAVGYYAILIKRRWPAARVVAVDALPYHLAALRANAALNGLAPDDLELREFAVGAAEGHADFADVGYGSSLADVLPAHRRQQLPMLRVRVRPLSAVLDGLPVVHLMKMDIQGAELAVLDAARDALTAGRVRHALIGTHGRRLHDKVREVLVACGFRIVHDDPAPPMQPDGILLARHG